jgi:hypothetical protein
MACATVMFIMVEAVAAFTVILVMAERAVMVMDAVIVMAVAFVAVITFMGVATITVIILTTDLD